MTVVRRARRRATSSGCSARSGEAFGGELDLLVHSVAYAAAEDLEGRFTDTPRDRFWMAVDVAAYSLVACARPAEPLMEAAGGGSILTMTYLGGERAVPHYNVMGVAKATLDASVRYLAWDLGAKNIRVNAVSAGPVRTLAARSIAGFPTMESIVEERSPLHRHVDADDVGAAAAYLLSDAARTSPGRRCTSTPATTRWACSADSLAETMLQVMASASRLAAVGICTVLVAAAAAAGGGARTSWDGCTARSGDVRFRAADGTRLVGHLYGRGPKAIALAHQSRGNLCQWLWFARREARRGYRALVFDLRNYGQSSSVRAPPEASAWTSPPQRSSSGAEAPGRVSSPGHPSAARPWSPEARTRGRGSTGS